MTEENRVAVVTGASSGIGAATAEALARAGFEVVIGARRRDRLDALAARIGGSAAALDVTDIASVDALSAALPRVDVLVNNAGLALGMEPVAELPPEHARRMWETNVLGLIQMTRALMPALEKAEGHIVNVTSTSAFETYAGGAGYTSTKHAARAVTKSLRLELLGKPVRISEIAPGMVETEFSQVRFDDPARAKSVYERMTPLAAEDVAEAIVWAVTRPRHVNVDEIVLRPLDQATSTMVNRRG